MNFKEYVKSQKDQEKGEEIPYFCGASIRGFKFLIDDYGFNKAVINFVGKECQVEFTRKEIAVKITYEMGVLPQLSVKINSSQISLEKYDDGFSEKTYSSSYKMHSHILSIIAEEYSSVKEYIKVIGTFWKENKKEIMAEVEKHVYYLAKKLKDNIHGILNP